MWGGHHLLLARAAAAAPLRAVLTVRAARAGGHRTSRRRACEQTVKNSAKLSETEKMFGGHRQRYSIAANSNSLRLRSQSQKKLSISNERDTVHPSRRLSRSCVGNLRARAFRHSRRCGQNCSFFARLSPAPHTSCLARRSRNWQGVDCLRQLATSLRTLLRLQSTMRKRR